MIKITLQEIARLIGATVDPAAGACPVTGVSTDTRTIKAGDLFFAFDGGQRSGSDFIGEAFRAGAVAAVSPRAALVSGPVLVVADPGKALLSLGAHVRSRLSIPVIAVTGTNGKTTTKDAIAALLGQTMRVVAAAGSFNNQIGVPLTICRADESTEVLVLEIGTSGPGEILALGKIARPTIALITCVGPGHLQGLAGIDGVLREKMSLAETLIDGGWLFLNGDDPRLANAHVPQKARLGRVMTFGLSESCDFHPIDATTDETGVGFRLARDGRRIHARLRGRQNLLNLAAAVAVARKFGLSDAALERAALTIVPPKMRMEERRVAGMTVIYDCYNANPLSMNAALDEWCDRPTNHRRVAVLGDMLELGDETERYHRVLGQKLAKLTIEKIILVGSAMKFCEAALLEAGVKASKVSLYPDVHAAKAAALGSLLPGDEVLLKGSRGIGLERFIETSKSEGAVLA